MVEKIVVCFESEAEKLPQHAVGWGGEAQNISQMTIKGLTEFLIILYRLQGLNAGNHQEPARCRGPGGVEDAIYRHVEGSDSGW